MIAASRSVTDAPARTTLSDQPSKLARRVTLYRAQGCHLCESAQRVLEQVRAEIPFELEEVEIDGDPELERLYRERIPVIAVDGEEAFTYFVHPEGLRRRLSG
jgi:glutaredoxin